MIYARLITRRLVASVLLMVAVVSASWGLTVSAPGRQAAGGGGGFLIDDALGAREAESSVGLLSWWRTAVTLDLGFSTRYRRPVLPLVAQRARNSALLGSCALGLALLIGVPMGCASSGRGWGAQVIRTVSVLLLSCPPLVSAMVLSWLAVRLGWSIGSPSAEGAGAWAGWQTLRPLILPTLALAIPLAAVFERLQSRALARVAGEPWLTALAARGLRVSAVWRHAWWAALPPVASVGGVIAGALLGGALAVEVITAWPGLGRLTFDALIARDTALVAGCAASTSLLVSVAALVSDLLVAWADPRARDAA
jgi:ABC-type dipeptide/oligopeptide/nickel transport system permease component